MSQTAVLVWLSASSLLPTFRAELSEFAQSRLLRLEAPRQNATTLSAASYAPDLVAELELGLEEARNAAAALEPSRALSALEHADAQLRAHPELPQSAWLMAELLLLRAEVEGHTEGGADAAVALRERARALEGVRAAPFSDRDVGVAASAPTARRVHVEGLELGDALEWDGTRASTDLDCIPGEHHARVLRQGRLLWAGWVQVDNGESPVRLPLPNAVPCSPDDIGQSRFVGHLALPAPAARCETYVLAQVDANGKLELALCEHERCGVSTRWNSSAERASNDRSRRGPVWPYTVTAAAGVLAITTLILWRSGAFERGDAPPTQTWVYNGLKPMAFRF